MARAIRGEAGIIPSDRPSGSYRVDRPARLAEAVVSPVIRWVVDGHFAAGDALPPEPKLVAEFGVSRTVIREALQELQKKGLTRTEHGKGTVVLGIDHWDLLDPDVLAALLESTSALRILGDLIEVRAVLESELVASATRRIDADELAAMEQLLERMAAARSTPDEYGQLEHQFHARLIEPSRNTVALGILRPVVRQLHLGGKRWADRIDGSTDLETAHAEHVQIFRLVSRRNAIGAAKAVRHHIETSWSWVGQALAAERDRG